MTGEPQPTNVLCLEHEGAVLISSEWVGKKSLDYGHVDRARPGLGLCR